LEGAGGKPLVTVQSQIGALKRLVESAEGAVKFPGGCRKPLRGLEPLFRRASAPWRGLGGEEDP